jgi:solute carrier family 25 carnitine/acylcarnitine transporter 20/29
MDVMDKLDNSETFKTKFIKGVNEFIAGSLGGMAGITVGHPVDTIRVRLQIQDPKNLKYTSFTDCFMKIIKEEKVNGLFKGLMSPLVGEMGNLALVFGIYGNMRKHVKNDDYWGITGCSLVAGITAVSVVVPVELVKIRLQTNSKEFRGFYGCLKDIIAQGGIKNLYHGLSATLFRDIPFNVSYFLSYEYSKNYFLRGKKELSTAEYLLCGGIAGTMSWAVIYPTDIVKSIVQASEKKIKVMNVAQSIYRSEGIRGFYRGWTPSVLRVIENFINF